MKEILERIAENATKEPTPKPLPRPTPQPLSLKMAILLATLLGSLPTLAHITLDYHGMLPREFNSYAAVLAVFGGLAGLGVAIIHKTFLRMIVGVNAGVLIGFMAGEKLETTQFWEFMKITCGAYALIVCIASVDISRIFYSVIRGAIVSILSISTMVGFVFLVIQVERWWNGPMVFSVIPIFIVGGTAPFIAAFVTLYFLVPRQPVDPSSGEISVESVVAKLLSKL